MKPETFYKLARPDGFDFYTNKTINYRANIGKTVKCPNFSGDGKLCSDTVIHASRKPDQCFVAAKIPCSAYLVFGVPILEDTVKCGFKELEVIRELQPENLFKWNYAEAVNLTNPFEIRPPEITEKEINILRRWVAVRASVWDSVRDSIENSAWDSVWDSVWASAWDSVWDSAWDSVRDSAWDSIWAYVGWIFSPVIKKWKYIKHKKGIYPFQPAVDLWKLGLVSSYDGKLWRLHGGKNIKILWEGK